MAGFGYHKGLAKPRSWTCRSGLNRRPRTIEWVSMAQLAREVDVAFNHWLQRRSGAATVVVSRRRGRPRNPDVTAAIAEWRSLGCPKQGFAEICRRNGANYGAACVRRSKEEKRRRARA